MEWVGFDDVKSIEVKMKYVREMQLGGAMLWSLDMDDFSGTYCQQGPYPILTTMNFYLNGAKNTVKLPRADVFYNSDIDSVNNKQPVFERSLITKANDKSFSTADFFSKHNVFSLMQNNGNL
jgi:GH18 family chitinase